MDDSAEVIIIGAGQAGLAVSHELTVLGIDHAILERGRIGETWRNRWDSFCLVTPNWSVQLPGSGYDGNDPDGFMPRDDIVRHLERYASSFSAPVREGVDVTAVAPSPQGGFRLTTREGELWARTVVLTAGAYQRPHRPGGETLPSELLQIDAAEYASPESLPPGGVLVIGSGQTGCQLAEELHQAGRTVTLACGRAPWGTRRLGGWDVFRWALETGFLDGTVEELRSPAARLVANAQGTGHGGGHDLHYRVLQAQGVTLAGHFLGADGGRARFAADLEASVAFGDARYLEFRTRVLETCLARGFPAPVMPEPSPFEASAPESLDLADLGAVIYTSGFRPDYARWVHIDTFDDTGFPLQRDGESRAMPNLFFCGVHFLRKRKSSLLMGAAEDAPIVARAIASSPPRGELRPG